MSAIMLYRPVGPEELRLIEASGWKRFPPRLPEQPIFYPVVQEAYARKIARDWNGRSSGAGYVMRFAVEAEYLARFEVHEVGSRDTEYWIPAEQLEEGGHAFGKHAGEFAGVSTQGQFAEQIEQFLNSEGTVMRNLSGGRTAYWNDSMGAVLIRNPSAIDGGTFFVPKNGVSYFWGLR